MNSLRRWPPLAHPALRIAFALFLGGVVLDSPAWGDATPARPLASPAAANLGDNDASQYWDLTAELESGHRIFARFQITNQGPGDNNATAIGHVITPGGEAVKFRNGRLESGWTLSKDRLDLDVGKSHLDLHPPRYRLRVNKKDVRIRLNFAPNALTSLPRKVTGKRYRVDLLALGATATGTLELEGADEIALEGKASLTHTVATKDETDLALRRFELYAQQGSHPFYAVQFLDHKNRRRSWAAWLEPRCDLAFAPEPFPSGSPKGGQNATETSENTLSRCIRVLGTTSKIEVAGRSATKGAAKRGDKGPYWIPARYTLSPNPPKSEEAEKPRVEGHARTAKRLLKYEALDDLPGPIRFVARLSTKPRRVWSLATFEVTIPPSLDSEPTKIQSQGVAIVSFLNPVTKP